MKDFVKFAVFSDVHGNLEALEAVLADIAAERVQEMICLGDIVGYGPNPAECIEMIRCLSCAVVMGNHDEACVEPEKEADLNEYARAGIAFARRQLSDAQKDVVAKSADCGWISRTLPRSTRLSMMRRSGSTSSALPMRVGTFLFQDKPLCFCGHTHRPGVWTQEGRKIRGSAPTGNVTYPLGARTLVNVGSVGQPRNMRPEACYAIYNRAAHSVAFRFIPYNLEGDPMEDLRRRSAALSCAAVGCGTLGEIRHWQIVAYAIRCTFRNTDDGAATKCCSISAP